MMKYLQQLIILKYPKLLLVTVTLLLLFLLFGNILIEPNSYLFGAGGDGLKSYYVTSYYVKYDQGLKFTGMNYPYGEHVVFSGNQPMTAAVLRWVEQNLFVVH